MSDSAWYDSAGSIDLSIRSMLASCAKNTPPAASGDGSATETATFQTSFTTTEDASSDGDSGAPVASPQQSETDIVSFRLEAQDATTGDPITNINVGEEFVLAVFVQDVRTPPAASNSQGVAAGYLNVFYDETLVSIDSGASITYGNSFDVAQTGNLTTAGIINGAGAFRSSIVAPGNDEQLLWTIPVQADSVGQFTFTSTFDTIASHDTLVYGSDDPVPEENSHFGTYELTVTAEGTPLVSIGDVTAAEGTNGGNDTPFVFTVSLSETSASTVNVGFSTAAGTAAVGDDFVGNSGTLTFDPGVTEQLITVMVKADALDEGDEDFTVNLSNPVNSFIVDGTGTGTIQDDDDPPSVSIGDVSEVEGDAGTVDMVFTATLSSVSGKTVTVEYATSDDTATDPSDYNGASGTITFAPGVTSQLVTVAAIGDTLDEDDETFDVTLSNPTNATLGDDTGVGTIEDDDDPPSVSIGDVTAAEGNSGTTDFLFTATLSEESGRTVTVEYATSDDTATAGSDYAAQSGTITFAPGVTSQTITVTVNGDTLDEDDETFDVTLSNPSNATLDDDTGVGTIENDDDPPTVSIGDVSQEEGDAGTTDFVFTATLSNVSGQTVTVEFATSDGTATDADNDYEPASGTITFAPGTTTQTITVAVNGDTTSELDETFNVTLSNPTNAALDDDTGIGTIEDDDPPEISISAPTTVTEGDTAASAEIVFTVSLSFPSASEVTVEFATADGTATGGSDYTAQSGTLTFAPGTTTQLVTVTVDGDTIDEIDEDFTVNLTNPVNGTLGTDSVTGTIEDDDDPPSLSISDATEVEGDSGTTDMLFTVSLSNESSFTVTASYTTSDDTATVGSDYTGQSGSVTFAPGETSKVITIAAIGDTVDEEDETFNVDLQSATNATIQDSQGVGTIEDDDDPPTVSISNNVSAFEGDADTTDFVFTATLSSESGKTVTVEFATNDGVDGATEGSDYTGNSGTLTFAPGETTKVVTVAVNGDTDIEENEQFAVELSNPTNATLGDDTGIGTIINDDGPHLTFTPTGVAQSEGDAGTTNFVFTVDIGETSASEVTVVYTTVDGTATAGSDYVAQSGTLTFAPGSSVQTITIAVNGDTTDEPDESFTVVLSDPVNATIAGGPATGTIENDDDPPSVSIGDATEVEGDAGTVDMVFTATLSQESGNTVTVLYATGDDSATAGSDYTAQSGTITFAPGETSQVITIAALGDTIDEDDETFDVTLSSPTNATLGDDTGTGTIEDDDEPPSVSIGDVSQDEGDSGTTDFVFTATLSQESGKTVTVLYATSDGTASENSDYNAASGTITFAPGETSQVITIGVNGDTDVENDESFTVSLSSPSNATLGDDTGTGTIENDDNVLISVGDESITELDDGETNELTFTVNLSTASNDTVTVEFDTQAGTATADVDYDSTSGTLTFAPGETSKIVTVTVNGDLLNEANETFSLRLFNSVNANNAESEATAVTAEGTILNDDPIPVLTFQPSSQTIVEGDSGTTEAVFTVSLSEASGQEALVEFFSEDSDATVADNDYQPISGTLTFAPGETEKLITVLINGDTKFELAEPFNINLVKIGDTYSLQDDFVNVVITADDLAPTLSISDVSGPEGNSGTSDFVFTVSLTGETQVPVVVQYTTAPQTALSGEDFVGQNGTLTFEPGVTEQLITVAVNGDTVIEPDETFTVNLSAPSNATIVDPQGVGTILTDEAQLSINDVSQVEGDSGTTDFVFTVTLANAGGSTVTAAFATSAGTATSGVDFTPTSGTLTFAPGVTTQNVTVKVIGDIFQEPDETFFVNLSSPTNATIGDGQGTGTIENGDDSVIVIPSSLSGFAFIDSDGGADKDPGELALSGITVTLFGASSITGNNVERTITTGADGSYRFDDLEPGTYNVAFSQPATYQPGTISLGNQGGTISADGLSFTTTIDEPGDVNGENNHFFVRGLQAQFISQRDFLASTPQTSSVNVAATPQAATATAQAATAGSDGFTQNGNVVTVHGTAGDDTFEFSTGNLHTVTLNGVTQQFDPAVVTDIVFDGGGGDDDAKLVGSAGSDVASFALGFGTLQGTGYKVTVGNVNSISVNGGGGNDSATLQDSIFDDDLVALGSEATLTNTLGQTTTLMAFEQVRAISSSGGNDTSFIGALDFTLEEEGSWTDL